MKKGLINTIIIFLFFTFAYSSCKQKSEYQRLVDSELATNIRQDSLFLGMSLQMDSKSFFGHCWELNKQGVLTNGVGNQIKYDASDYFENKTLMFFYPKFQDGKIVEMPIDFQYAEWALWNEDLKIENLLEEVKATLLEWYGGSFIKMVNEEGTKTVWVKVDGNRRIRVFRKSISEVSVVITDLLELDAKKEEKS
ncbi:hypothetical protein [Roseivirga sp.]|uniref:hypothetical protein n=1 Tax=Roseivirga sp. TaxID=1964215 RepID=UPI003B8D70EA